MIEATLILVFKLGALVYLLIVMAALFTRER